MSYQFTISDIGLRLIKAYEGYWPEARALSSGGQVVGFGHRVVDGEDEAFSEEEAETVLKADLAPIEDLINSRVHASMTQSQFDALCSLVFSIGEDAFLASDMLHDLNRGQVIEASSGFDMWRKGNIDGRIYVVDALVRRRTAEKALFLRPTQRIARAPRFELASLRDTSALDIDQPKTAAPVAAAKTATPQLDAVLDIPIDTDVDVNTDPDTTLQTLAVPADPIIYSDDVAEETPWAIETASPLTVVEEMEAEAETVTPEGLPTLAIVETQTEDFLQDTDDIISEFVNRSEDSGQDADEVHIEEPIAPQDEPETSPIAAAAAAVSDRLDALIEDKPNGDAENDAESNTLTTNLLAAENGSNDRGVEVSENDTAPGVVMIDELQQDDALREQIARESQYNTNRYDDYVEVEDETGNRGILAFGLMTLIGLAAAITGLVINLRGSVPLLGENGPFITVAAMLIGGLLIIVGLLYLMKAIFTRD